MLDDKAQMKAEFIQQLKEAHVRILTKSYGISKAQAEQAWEF